MPSKQTKRNSHWSTEELAYVKRNYRRYSIKEIAAHLGRPYGGVAYQISQLRQAGLIDREMNNPVTETTTAVPVVEPTRKPWWKFW